MHCNGSKSDIESINHSHGLVNVVHNQLIVCMHDGGGVP